MAVEVAATQDVVIEVVIAELFKVVIGGEKVDEPYFPITTGLLISAVLTLVLWLGWPPDGSC